MPRPRVQPQDRLRSVRACDPCNASKKRCDSNLPCRQCSQRGHAITCVYTRPDQRRASQRRAPAPLMSSLPSHDGSQSDGFLARRPRTAAVGDGKQCTYAQQPVMLSSSSGEKGMAATYACSVLVYMPFIYASFWMLVSNKHIKSLSVLLPQSPSSNPYRRHSNTILAPRDLQMSNTVANCSRLPSIMMK